ncbi:MAG: hypothetical protein LBT05_01985 [Planctomycetaceae bacterium]|jgi:hypothetical protein|nr:hypothetical protein [Planctomycetaceae bacterium]
MMKVKCCFVFLFACFCLSFIGCGDNVGLRGKVTFSDTHEPLTIGEIHFSTPTFLARAAIRPDGTYVAGSEKVGNGLPPGTYAVTIMYAEEAPPENQQPEIGRNGLPKPIQPKSLIHPKYKRKETSGLTVTVDQSGGVFDFEVDRAPH